LAFQTPKRSIGFAIKRHFGIRKTANDQQRARVLLIGCQPRGVIPSRDFVQSKPSAFGTKLSSQYPEYSLP
jgi:hypothetical protein